MTKINNRSSYFQAIRGIAIMCVVLIHCQTGIGYATDTFNYNYWLLLRQFINFPVAVFFFIAAYFTSFDEAINDTPKYYLKRGSRIIVPFLTWSAFYTVISLIWNQSTFTFKMLVNILTGGAVGPFYFIFVLIQLVFLTPFLIRYLNKRWMPFLIFGLSIVYLGVYYLNYFDVIAVPHYFSRFFPAWWIFYYIGLRWKEHNLNNEDGTRTLNFKPIFNLVSISAIALLLSIMECYLLKYVSMQDRFLVSQIKISSIFYATSIIFLIMYLKEKYKEKQFTFLSYLGDNSYGIFYIHCFWLMVLQLAFRFFSIQINLVPLLQIIQLTVITTCSLISIKVVRKIFGKKSARVFLGF